ASACPERRLSFEKFPIRVGNSLFPERRRESAVSLDIYRGQLMERLKSGNAFASTNGAETMRIAELWWGFYKDWESKDRVKAAFDEGRMTVRQIPVPKDMQSKPFGEIADYELIYGTYKNKATNEVAKGEFAFGIRRGEVEKQAYPNERYRVGTNALKERMNPANFGMDNGERLKYRNGLHDMSASLCTPKLPKLTNQVRWKHGELSVRVTVFMPLAWPADLEAFYRLNAAAKAGQGTYPNGYVKTTEWRRRMTRIKLAEGEAIGAGLRDVGTSDKPKIRYGMKEELVDGKLSDTDTTRAENDCKYTTIPKTEGDWSKPKWGKQVFVTNSTNE